jgi:hypothetical protein
MTLDIADYVMELFPNFGPVQAAGAVAMYHDQGNNVNQANLVMGECTFVLQGTCYLSDFMGRFSNIHLSYLSLAGSVRRTSLEGKLLGNSSQFTDA